jgi:hypothetical protein
MTAEPSRLPAAIETYDSKSEELARQLAKSPHPKFSDRKKVGEQLILESTAALEHVLHRLEATDLTLGSPTFAKPTLATRSE